jgi:hypothetical protein
LESLKSGSYPFRLASRTRTRRTRCVRRLRLTVAFSFALIHPWTDLFMLYPATGALVFSEVLKAEHGLLSSRTSLGGVEAATG